MLDVVAQEVIGGNSEIDGKFCPTYSFMLNIREILNSRETDQGKRDWNQDVGLAAMGVGTNTFGAMQWALPKIRCQSRMK